MSTLDVTFDLPAQIAAGLANSTLVRNGGVIQDNAGRVVTWLREIPNGDISGTSLAPIGGASNLSAFAGVGSMLTLGVSVLGFSVIYAKVKALEGRLQEVQKTLEVINEKIDISFYANFRAALDLARNAFSMEEESNRRNSALQAINRFLEAEHVYTDLLNKELECKGQLCGDYLLTLCLAYLAEVRCYLELGENNTALRRFQESKIQIQENIEKYIDILLTEKPLIYLHPRLKGSVDLSRLTKIYQWKDSSFNENKAFELFRDSLLKIGNHEEWIKALPSAVIEPSKIKKGFWGIPDESVQLVFELLPQVVDRMESIIETHSRFTAYEFELYLLTKTSLQKWENLKSKQTPPEGASLMYMVPPKPLMLGSATKAATI